jgi:hypothetical protein
MATSIGELFATMSLDASAFKGAIRGLAVEFLGFQKLFETGMKAIQNAAEDQKVRHMLDGLFEGSADAMEKWADDLATTTGSTTGHISKIVADTTMGIRGIFRESGEGMADAMAKNLIELSQDVESFMADVSDTQALGAFEMALLGNDRALRSIHMSISDTDKKNEALKLGLGSSEEAWTKEEKAVIAYNAILEKTLKMQDDAKTSTDQYARSLKQFKSGWDELLGSMGQPLLDAITGVMNKFSELFKSIRENVKAVVSPHGWRHLPSGTMRRSTGRGAGTAPEEKAN